MFGLGHALHAQGATLECQLVIWNRFGIESQNGEAEVRLKSLGEDGIDGWKRQTE